MSHRIALLIHALHGGGAERLMSELACRWAEEHEIHLVTWSSAESDQYQVAGNVIRHALNAVHESKTLLQGIASNLKRVRRLRKNLESIRPDLILSFSDQMNILSLEASRSLKVPHWISEHSHPAKQRLSRLWEAWRRRSYPRCSGCTVLTPGIADWMSQLMDRSKILVIPPSIPTPQSPPDEDQAKFDASAKTILFVGRLSREKRIDLLIGAWRQIAAAHPDWRLRIVGDGPEGPTLRQQASDVPRIEFTGWSASPRAHYREASLFVLPSEYEGFPVALLEALSFGVPCLSTNCSDAIDQLLSEQPHCLCTTKVGDSAELATKLESLIGDESRRIEMQHLGQLVSQKYQWHAVGRLWDQILHRSLPT